MDTARPSRVRTDCSPTTTARQAPPPTSAPTHLANPRPTDPRPVPGHEGGHRNSGRDTAGRARSPRHTSGGGGQGEEEGAGQGEGEGAGQGGGRVEGRREGREGSRGSGPRPWRPTLTWLYLHCYMSWLYRPRTYIAVQECQPLVTWPSPLAADISPVLSAQSGNAFIRCICAIRDTIKKICIYHARAPSRGTPSSAASVIKDTVKQSPASGAPE